MCVYMGVNFLTGDCLFIFRSLSSNFINWQLFNITNRCLPWRKTNAHKQTTINNKPMCMNVKLSVCTFLTSPSVSHTKPDMKEKLTTPWQPVPTPVLLQAHHQHRPLPPLFRSTAPTMCYQQHKRPLLEFRLDIEKKTLSWLVFNLCPLSCR